MTRRLVTVCVVLALAGCSSSTPRSSSTLSVAVLSAAVSSAALSSSQPLAPEASSAGVGVPSETSTAKPSAATPSTAKPTPAASPLAPFYGQRLVWGKCGGGFSCASAIVPLDYAKPGGKRIEIAMIKLPARKSKGRIGSLFLNPGGPGASGIGYARYAESVIPAGVRERFDIVGFDPRGVGGSAPVRCATGRQLDEYLSPDPSPDTDAELQQLVSAAKTFAARCAETSGDLLPHISTRNTARDLDVLREAVGDAKLSYLGKSYGTYLGALYADLFPRRVRALILDGAVDPTVDTQTLARVQARGFEVALTAFLDSCAASSSCEFGTAPDIRGRFDSLLARIERQPLKTSGSRLVGPDEVYYAVAQALYSRQYGWPVLRTALFQAQRGDGSTLLQLYDDYVRRDEQGQYDGLIESYVAIGCLDRPSPRDVETYQADARRFAPESPHFGAGSAFGGLTCAYWPVPPVGPPAALPARGAAPILVIGTTRDPATPLVWSQALAQQLESGRLLTYNGDGHTVYGDGDDCVDGAGNAYLIALKLPPVGKRCG
ncbi:MAG: alpha/beta hydrolase [Mycobacteriales bacterium]